MKQQFGNKGIEIDRQMYDLTAKVTAKIHECEKNIREISEFIPGEGEHAETATDLISNIIFLMNFRFLQKFYYFFKKKVVKIRNFKK